MFDQKEYIKQFNKEKYWIARININKNEKDKMIEHAKSKGYDKFSEYVKSLIYADMENSTGGGTDKPM